MSSPRTYAMIPVELIAQFRSKWDVENYIEEHRNSLKSMEHKILHYFHMTEPKKFISEDQDPFYVLQNDFDAMFPEVEDAWDPGYGQTYYEMKIAEAILENWDVTHHSSGMAYPDKDPKGYCVGDGIQECDENGVPLDYNGNPITKDSGSYEQLLAFNYVKKLADGTTREDYDAEMKRRHEEYEKNMENNEPSEQIK